MNTQDVPGREQIDPASPIRASFSMDRQARDAIRWVAERYHVDQGDIVDFAPALFTIFAEHALNRRRKRLGQLVTMLDQARRNLDGIRHIAPHLGPHTKGLQIAMEQLVEAERAAIESRDLTRGNVRGPEGHELYGLYEYGDAEEYLEESRLVSWLHEALIEMVEQAGGTARRDTLGEGGTPAYPHCIMLDFGSNEPERLAARPNQFKCLVSDRPIEILVTEPDSFFSRLGA